MLTGKLNFRKLAQSILADLARMIVRQQMFNSLTGLKNIFGGGGNIFSGLFGKRGGGGSSFRPDLGGMLSAPMLDPIPNIKFANGAAFASNQIIPYAKGGIVNKPQVFGFSRGIGLMGEAGPEAILPLQRGKGGKLGVIAQGGGTGNITVNVDATGSSVEGDEEQANALGSAIATAIQSELIKQKRPGGLLA